ncbi:GHMP kinase [Bizionia argentinensis JUB59]|uniref:GHMP kinase n=1 Tax=Bizionia argentinensis JUB59 TaxID=1046627 RepID=G2EDX5_9FLAO|nr:GYDIA family GHMP kinase [Bizionia argentinensis]EGV43419.1 GHMP kinase [Bizionia argentinensis JUB59]
MKRLYSNGKLLLTGEYLVLDGAKALALPTKFGQFLDIKPIESKTIEWKSKDEKGRAWFEDTFTILKEKISSLHEDAISNRLVQILQVAKQLNPDFLKTGYAIESRLTFPRNWGLGSSSTLLNNIADWADIDPYLLLNKTFGGSGYDIACARHETAITYQLQNEERLVESIHFNPTFKEDLYFVYLNQKQNSRDGISSYRNTSDKNEHAILEINEITNQMLVACNSLEHFNGLLKQHEAIISSIIKQPTVKARLFPDYEGQLKSLGAWGGDFILATATKNPESYFKEKGYHTVIRYQDLIL